MTNAPFVKFNWEFNRSPNLDNKKPLDGQVLNDGSGGNYLSNEIFYRVAKLRKDQRPSLPSGHFHISKLQDEETNEDFSNEETMTMISIVKRGIEEGVKGLKI